MPRKPVRVFSMDVKMFDSTGYKVVKTTVRQSGWGTKSHRVDYIRNKRMKPLLRRGGKP